MCYLSPLPLCASSPCPAFAVHTDVLLLLTLLAVGSRLAAAPACSPELSRPVVYMPSVVVSFLPIMPSWRSAFPPFSPGTTASDTPTIARFMTLRALVMLPVCLLPFLPSLLLVTLAFLGNRPSLAFQRFVLGERLLGGWGSCMWTSWGIRTLYRLQAIST